jgi:nickel/cobalt exporter
MTGFADVLQQGGASALLFIPTAMLLGALHGLEPGHSKTLMAAFIIAVRGTVAQAVLLGIAATISHTLVVWVVVLAGLYFFAGVDAAATEPYFQIASAVLIIGIAAWMMQRTWREQQALKAARAAGAALARPAMRQVDTGHGRIGLELRRDGATGAARWHVTTLAGAPWAAEDVRITTTAADGQRKQYRLDARDGHLESRDAVPEPHVFTATISLNHHDHDHDFEVAFTSADAAATAGSADEPMDAHARAHATDIKKRFADRSVTTGQIVMFGLTGGLIPCPAAITVLLLCLQVQQLALGAVLVLSFSLGLALVMVAAGVAAALGVRHAAKRFSGFRAIGARASYASSILIILLGIYLGYAGLHALSAGVAGGVAGGGA